jgi:hypothetical protein
VRRNGDQVGDDFLERSAGIRLMRAVRPEERLDLGVAVTDRCRS